MARHDQRPDKALMTCAACKKDAACSRCVDVPRLKLGLQSTICTCGRADHAKEVSDAVQPVPAADPA